LLRDVTFGIGSQLVERIKRVSTSFRSWTGSSLPKRSGAADFGHQSRPSFIDRWTAEVMYPDALAHLRMQTAKAVDKLFKYDVFVLLCIFLEMFFAPVLAAFSIGGLDSIPMLLTMWTLDVIFLLEAVRNFRSVRMSPTPMEDYPLALRISDSISAVPLASLFQMIAQLAHLWDLVGVLPILRMLRLLRMQRVAHGRRALARTELKSYLVLLPGRNLLPIAIADVLIHLALTLIACHLLCCLWILAAVYERDFFPDKVTWLTSLSQLLGRNASETEVYIAGLAFAQSCITITQLSPVKPVTRFETAVATLFYAIGFSLFMYMLAATRKLRARLTMSSSMSQKKMTKLHKFCRNNDIPRQLVTQMRSYFQGNFMLRKFVGEAKLLSEMPPTLRMEVLLALKAGVLFDVPLLTRLGNLNIIHDLMLQLKPQLCSQGEVVIQQGDFGREMFILSEGVLAIIVNGNKVAELRSGSFFGEVALLFGVRRTASVTAMVVCFFFSLSKLQFEATLNEYPREKELFANEVRRNADSITPSSEIRKQMEAAESRAYEAEKEIEISQMRAQRISKRRESLRRASLILAQANSEDAPASPSALLPPPRVLSSSNSPEDARSPVRSPARSPGRLTIGPLGKTGLRDALAASHMGVQATRAAQHAPTPRMRLQQQASRFSEIVDGGETFPVPMPYTPRTPTTPRSRHSVSRPSEVTMPATPRSRQSTSRPSEVTMPTTPRSRQLAAPHGEAGPELSRQDIVSTVRQSLVHLTAGGGPPVQNLLEIAKIEATVAEVNQARFFTM
jgi:CRP-like cAMP-binding protein